MIEFKASVYYHLNVLQDEKIGQLQASLSSLYDDLASASKSSSGDKHETGRAMIQLEQEQLGKQLNEALLQKNHLNQLDISHSRDYVSNGSLIESDDNWYFICSVPAKIKIDNFTVYSISLNSPLGQLLSGKKQGESIHFNSKKISLKNIY
jgi:hypothetical protein